MQKLEFDYLNVDCCLVMKMKILCRCFGSQKFADTAEWCKWPIADSRLSKYGKQSKTNKCHWMPNGIVNKYNYHVIIELLSGWVTEYV